MTMNSINTHTISANGLTYDICQFKEDESGEGGVFKVIGMDHERRRPSLWNLDTIPPKDSRPILIVQADDASDIYHPSTPMDQRTHNTVFRFSYDTEENEESESGPGE
jgi:hypothetical protein